jgi:1-acyl-sn-glycerol-3-phosphate acyltransferase
MGVGRLIEEPTADADTAATGNALCPFAQPRWISAGIWWLLLCFSGAPTVRGTSTQAFSGGNTLLLGSTAADGGAGGGTGSENGFFAALTHQAGEPIMPNPPDGLSNLGNAPTPLPTLRAA